MNRYKAKLNLKKKKSSNLNNHKLYEICMKHGNFYHETMSVLDIRIRHAYS